MAASTVSTAGSSSHEMRTRLAASPAASSVSAACDDRLAEKSHFAVGDHGPVH
jgi:hypothetical protein